MAGGAFTTHLLEAIAINKERRQLYGRLSGGRSVRLSRLLVLFERLSVPFARYIDWRARRFQRAGVPIIEDDFVSMSLIRAAETPPRFRARLDGAGFDELRRATKAYTRGMRRVLRRADFARAAEESLSFLEALEQREEAARCHLAMTRHFVESIGLAATNAERYAAMSGGATVSLSKSFLRLQCTGIDFPIVWPVTLDRMAQALHADGIGIVVNDIPDIPFKARFKAANGA